MPEEKGFSGYDHSEMWGLVMVGGYRDISSVITTDNGKVFGSLPDLPEETSFACVVIIDEDRIFTCGGSYGVPTLIFTNSTGSWNM